MTTHKVPRTVFSGTVAELERKARRDGARLTYLHGVKITRMTRVIVDVLDNEYTVRAGPDAKGRLTPIARWTSGAPMVGLPLESTPEPDEEVVEAEPVEPEPGLQRVDLPVLLKKATAALDALQVDFANYRRNVERDREAQAEQANADLLSDLLPVADDLERAQTATADEAALRRGLDLIVTKLLGLMAKRGVTPIVAAGLPFDPAWHQAVTIEVSDRPEGEVLAEFQRGYMLGKRLLRPAMVKVATKENK